MKAGILLPNIGPHATKEDVIYVSKAAEAGGLDSVWVIERLLWPIKPQTPYVVTPDGSLPREYLRVLDPLETLTYVAANTERVALGTSVVDMPYYTPVQLARRITTLDVFSGGRVIAGLGLGWSKDEYDVSNVPFKDRGARADEFLEVMKRIWTDDIVEYKGRFYNVPPSKIDLKPIQKPYPPIVLGGFTPKTFGRVIKYADGWMPIAGFGPLDQLRQSVTALKEEAKKQGRDSSKLKVFVLTYPNLSESPIADEKRMPMGGTVDQIGSDIAQMKQMGLDHIIFGYLFSPIGDDMKRTVDLSIQLAKFAK